MEGYESVEYADSTHDTLSRTLENAFLDADAEAVVTANENNFTIELPGIHALEISIQDGEVVVDYIESDSIEAGAADRAVNTLKQFAASYGYTLRASNVLPVAVALWERNGFHKEGNDYLYIE